MSVMIIGGFLIFLGIVGICWWVFHNPFHYPYFEYEFDVSRKRNVKIEDYIDRFLCLEKNWDDVKTHHRQVEQWKVNSQQYAESCLLKNWRERQYRKSIDDENAYQFVTVRSQTRYKQRNYVRAPYQVYVDDNEKTVSWEWMLQRRERLARIGFESTLRDYHSKNQRKLMTPALRRQIMDRDNYTCQMCGKYMPDGVGLQIDHIIPVAKGGKTVPSNLQVLCSKCNGWKSSK